MNLLGDGECYSIGVYAHIGMDENGFTKYLNNCLNLDPTTNGAHAIQAANYGMGGLQEEVGGRGGDERTQGSQPSPTAAGH